MNQIYFIEWDTNRDRMPITAVSQQKAIEYVKEYYNTMPQKPRKFDIKQRSKGISIFCIFEDGYIEVTEIYPLDFIE